MAGLSNKTIQQVQSDLKGSIQSCENLVDAYLQRIEANKHLNAFLEVYSDEAIERAKFLDKKTKNKLKNL